MVFRACVCTHVCWESRSVPTSESRLSRFQSPGSPGSEVTVPVQANKGMWEWRHVCIRVCVCVYVYVYIMSVFIHTCMYVFMRVCIHTCMYPYVYVFICACMCVFIHTCMYECIHVYVHAHMAWGHAWMYASSCVCRHVHVHVYGRRRHVTTHSWGALCMYVHARGTKNSIHARKICAYKRSSKSFAQTRIPIFRSGIPTCITYADTYICVCASM
jgi:hypothetical protein